MQYLKFRTSADEGATSWFDDPLPLKLKTHETFVLIGLSSAHSLLDTTNIQ